MQSAQTNRTQADTSKNAPGESGRADLPVPGIKSKHLAEKVTIAITCNSLAHRELISPGEPDLSKSWVGCLLWCGSFAALPSMDCPSSTGWLKRMVKTHTDRIWRRYDLPTLPLSARRRSFYGLGGQVALFEMWPRSGFGERRASTGSLKEGSFLEMC